MCKKKLISPNSTLRKLSKYLLILLFLIPSVECKSQEDGPKTVLYAFFEALNNKDSAGIVPLLEMECNLTSYGLEGTQKFQTKKEFLSAIARIPENVQVEEKIGEIHSVIDVPLAICTVPYKFFINQQFSHCGMNVFHLIKKNESWKIIYIADTRKKENCINF